MPTRPPFRRRRLGARLQAMRLRAKMTLDDAAEALDKARSTMHRIEQGETRVDIHLIRSMMDLYDQYEPDLLEQTRRAGKPGWWVTYGLQDLGYIDVETEASVVRELSLLFIPGLLQTESYMRAFFAARRVRGSTANIENQVKVRLIRQLRLTDSDDSLRLVALIDEAVLRKHVGGPEVMRKQLRHLILASRLSTVTIQVLPDRAGAHDGMNGAFTMLSFPEPHDPEVLYVEYPTGSLHIEAENEVREAKLVFEHLASRALDPEESIALIERVLAEQYGPE
ncbi:helix-turn-helix domain-containing protein [Umezawaea sp. NPDC059074]|uniref:helix-turn-helix domain-containing protein n=1 Tax=Umezawaea sp. NPDC059074 TaxID=3346716 RepID=UPI00369E9EF4